MYADRSTLLSELFERAQRGDLEPYAAIREERAIYEACSDEYGYACLALQAVAEPA